MIGIITSRCSSPAVLKQLFIPVLEAAIWMLAFQVGLTCAKGAHQRPPVRTSSGHAAQQAGKPSVYVRLGEGGALLKTGW